MKNKDTISLEELYENTLLESMISDTRYIIKFKLPDGTIKEYPKSFTSAKMATTIAKKITQKNKIPFTVEPEKNIPGKEKKKTGRKEYKIIQAEGKIVIEYSPGPVKIDDTYEPAARFEINPSDLNAVTYLLTMAGYNKSV